MGLVKISDCGSLPAADLMRVPQKGVFANYHWASTCTFGLSSVHASMGPDELLIWFASKISRPLASG